MDCKAVIFDLDGTLIDSLCDLWMSTNHALMQCGFPLRTRDEVCSFVGNGVGELIHKAVPRGTDAEQEARCLDCFRAHYVEHCRDHTGLYEGVEPMLATLRARGLRTAIVSNKLQAGVDSICQWLFRGLVDVAVGEHGHVRRKPWPDMLLEAMRQLRVEPHEVVYVGDSDVDIQTARAAGVPCLSVLWGFRSRDFLLAHGARVLLSHPQEVCSFLFPPQERPLRPPLSPV